MRIATWHLLVIAALAVNAVFAYRAYRLGKSLSEGAGGTVTSSVPDGQSDGVVECPACGVENELGYRYCRNCVQQLPASMDFGRGAGSPLGRLG